MARIAAECIVCLSGAVCQGMQRALSVGECGSWYRAFFEPGQRAVFVLRKQNRKAARRAAGIGKAVPTAPRSIKKPLRQHFGGRRSRFKWLQCPRGKLPDTNDQHMSCRRIRQILAQPGHARFAVFWRICDRYRNFLSKQSSHILQVGVDMLAVIDPVSILVALLEFLCRHVFLGVLGAAVVGDAEIDAFVVSERRLAASIERSELCLKL